MGDDGKCNDFIRVGFFVMGQPDDAPTGLIACSETLTTSQFTMNSAREILLYGCLLLRKHAL